MTDRDPTDLQHWEDLLSSINPVLEANRLANAVLDPRTASPDECWEAIWEKPLFANTRVEAGTRAKSLLQPYMVNAWHNWGTEGGAFAITHLGGRNQRDNFNISGHQASAIDGLGIARHRLLAIQGGAKLLKALVEKSNNHPFQPMLELNRRQMINHIRLLGGRGWGNITVFHLLTDFGLAVKPDLHLVRTVKAIGLLPKLPERNVPGLEDALQINDGVDCLGRQIFGDEFGPRNRRYLDKILMELSRQGLLGRIGRRAGP